MTRKKLLYKNMPFDMLKRTNLRAIYKKFQGKDPWTPV